MRSESHIDTGYAANDLDTWAARAHTWAQGGDLAELPHVSAPVAEQISRDVYVYFISSAKERNPAAAMALQRRVDAGA
jgi:uncharacterized protein YecE (DUF72 family)